jgi:outer membrane protein assembly factor BamB
MRRALLRLYVLLLAMGLSVSCSSHGGGGMLPQAGNRGKPQAIQESYASVILGDSPIAYYQLNDTGTTAADSSGNGLNGTIGSLVTTGVTGLLTSTTQSAMAFPGTDSTNASIKVAPSALLQPSSAVSLEGWFEFSSTPANFAIIAAYGKSSGSATYELYFKNGAIIAQATLAGGIVTVASGTLNANQIYYAAETYDGTNVHLYLNGVQIAQSSAKVSTLTYSNPTYGLSIGDDNAAYDASFDGTIAEVAVYPTALSAAKVNNHYSAGTAPATPTPPPTPTPMPTATPTPNPGYETIVLGDHPEALYLLNDTGTVANDGSGNSLSGTIGSAVVTGAPALQPALNTAASFPGLQSSTAAVKVPPSSLLQPSGQVSIEAWFEFQATPANFTVVAEYGKSAGSASYELYFKNGAIVAQATLASGLVTTASSTALSTNQVYYAVETYDGNYVRLYLNGTLNSASSLHSSTLSYSNPTYGVSIGDDNAAYDPGFAGTISDVGIYTSALTATQIQNHYNAGTTTPSPGVDWDSFGFDLERSGYNPNETAVGAANVSSLQHLWTVNVGSSMVFEPVLASNVNVNGQTTNVLYAGSAWGSTMYAINALTGSIIWQKPVPSAPYQCGSSPSQFSIGETPAIDRAKNRVYFADGENQVHALDLGTGAEAQGWPITVADYTPDHNFMHGGFTYNPANGMLYAVTGSTCDITPWYGRIVAINTSSGSIAGQFYPVSGTSVPGGSGGGIWGPGGASIDPATNDVFIAVGNADTHTGQVQTAGYAEQVVQLSADLSTVLAANFPANWSVGPGEDDLDFGATPLLFTPPGCPEMLAAMNKTGMLEVYDVNTLAGGPVQAIQMSISTDTADFVGVPAYDPVTNMVYVGLPSTFGNYLPGLGAFSIQTNCTLNPTPAWAAQFGPDGATTSGQTRRSPISIANGVVYVSNYSGDTAFAFNAATGAQLWTESLTGTGLMGTVVADGYVYVSSADGNINAWALGAQAQAAARARRVIRTKPPQ